MLPTDLKKREYLTNGHLSSDTALLTPKNSALAELKVEIKKSVFDHLAMQTKCC